MPKIKLSLFPLLVFLCALSSTGLSQTRQAASILHKVHKIQSKVVNEERRILVNVPQSYEKTKKKYPVVYMLDGHTPQPGMMGSILAQQAWGGQMPEMILVSIQNTVRSRDLTPTDDGKCGKVGGAGKFLEFIENELIPLVEKNYRTQPYRIFAGHSLGGLTVVYSFVSRPDLFDAYIAASPVLHYDKNYVIKEAKKLFEQKKRWNKKMFVAIGDEPQYIGGFKSFKKLLKTENPKGFEYDFKEFSDDNHASVVLPAYYWGLRKIFEGWDPKNGMTISLLERHYRDLSSRYRYEILIPETTLNQIGYMFLREGKMQDAISVFKKNVKNHPDSANVYDSLGEAYEKNGSKRRARENYQKAYDIATKKGESRQAKVYKKNLDRVSPK